MKAYLEVVALKNDIVTTSEDDCWDVVNCEYNQACNYCNIGCQLDTWQLGGDM